MVLPVIVFYLAVLDESHCLVRYTVRVLVLIIYRTLPGLKVVLMLPVIYSAQVSWPGYKYS